MDFHSLTRRELQALCKKNKIPANITNVAMADALAALHFVEGIEELLNPSESETTKSSIESPKKSEIASPHVPPTGCTTTRSRRTTRRMLAGEVEAETPATAAAPTTRRRAAATSIRRKIEMPPKESEQVVEKEKKDIPQTPAALPASRRRGIKENGGASVRNAYSTRRSARLAEKNLEPKERATAIKIDSFAEHVLGEVFDNAGFGLKEKSCLSENGGDLEVGTEEEKTSEIKIDVEVSQPTAEDVTQIKAEIDSEMSDESDFLAGDNVEKPLEEEIEIEEMNGSEDLSILETENATDKDVKLDMDKHEDSDSMITEDLDIKVPEFEGAANIAIDLVSCQTVGQLESEDGKTLGSDDDVAQQNLETMDADNNVNCEPKSTIHNDKEELVNDISDEIHDALQEDQPIEATLDDNTDLESDFPCDVISADQFNQEEESDTEDATPVSNDILECENPIKDANQQLIQDEIISEDLLDAENSAIDASGSQTAGDVFLPPLAPPLLDFIIVDTEASTLAADLSEIASIAITRPASLTPVKQKSAGKTPKTARRMTNISDDKENVDSGRKLVLTKEKPKKKNKDIAGTDNQKPLEEISLRQLTKMFKQKLEITQKLNKSKKADEIKLSTSRPALKTLSENCLVGEPQN